MFSLSKGEPPTPPTTTPATEGCEIPQLRRTEAPIRSLSTSVESSSSADQQEFAMRSLSSSVESSSSTDQHQSEGATPRELPPIRPQTASVEKDSGFEASPCCLSEPESYHFSFDDCDEVFESVAEQYAHAILLEREEDDDWCPDCGEISCSCSRAESSATVRRGAVSSYTDPNLCDSDSSSRSSSPPSPPPSSWSIPVSGPHIHNDRMPCPRCSGGEALEAPRSPVPYLQTIVASRSFPGSYPAALLNWLAQRPQSSPAFTARVVATLSRPSNRSHDRRSTRSRRRQIDSDASSSSSCDENSSDEVFPTSCGEGSYLENLGTMTEAEELRGTSPEQLPDLVPLSSESSSRRVRSQSVSLPVDQEYLREIGITLRRLSNDFENRYAERNGQSRRSSLTSFLNLNWRS